MYWTLGDLSGISQTEIATYVSSTSSVSVKEPWKSRGWDVSWTNGDLIIPEVLLSDEGEYYCGGTKPRSLLVLHVHGEFRN